MTTAERQAFDERMLGMSQEEWQEAMQIAPLGVLLGEVQRRANLLNNTVIETIGGPR